MSIRTTDLHRELDLRSRAVSKLVGGSKEAETRLTAVTAMGVLHTLASSAETAGDALAVLHELQVHQVELELQYEELQRAGAELEASLVRQTELYDYAPVALLSIDADGRLLELNLAAARWLGEERHALVGQALRDFLAFDSRSTLNTLLEGVRIAGAAPMQSVALILHSDPAATVRATASADSAGGGFLLALSGTD